MTEPKLTNRQLRTRKDLMRAASQLLKEGRKPTMDEIADQALVSRATAYRYFPNLESLLAEAPLDGEVPEPTTLFEGDHSEDAIERIERAEAALHAMTYRNEAQLRALLAHSLERWLSSGETDVPTRQNRRSDLIEAALAPVKKDLTRNTYRTLCSALALVFGLESMIVCSDVLGLDEKTARKVKSWAVRALVRSALAEAQGS